MYRTRNKRRRSGRSVFAGVAVLTAMTLTAPPASAAGDPPRAQGSQAVCGGTLAMFGCRSQVATVDGAILRGTKPIGWGADDLRAAYGLPARSPHRGTIALINVGSYPTLSDDLAVYRKQYGLPACGPGDGCFRQMDFTGGPALPAPGTDDEKLIAQGSAIETALDVDMASATCPSCRLLSVQIPIGNGPTDPTNAAGYDRYAAAFGKAVRTAIDAGADAVSISYALPGSENTLHGPIAEALDHRGVAITAAAGDLGFNGNGNTGPGVTIPGFTGSAAVWPQALPTVTAVGGTTLVGKNHRYLQGAWAQGGSGCTPGVTPPEDQPATVSALCRGSRASTDVSAVAENLAMYTSYRPADHAEAGWLVLAGTSAAAPQIAGMYAAGGKLRDVHGPNTLYRAPSPAFSDIESGANLIPPFSGTDGHCSATRAQKPDESLTRFDDRMCRAGRGWDGPTGLGVPHGLLAF
ncbi:S8 family serine peptidase [Amycolatopsis sp. NPDC089917]|uniref:S8 family serine peptidase n=1 Tax=Amycolatopsis sp. NPDC089917 TaxID=3155187 RepID=UPI00342181AC